MQTDTLKLKLNNFVYDLIDKVFPKSDILSSIGNATAKFYIDQNMYKLDTYLKPFADVNGDIEVSTITTSYSTDEKVDARQLKQLEDDRNSSTGNV